MQCDHIQHDTRTVTAIKNSIQGAALWGFGGAGVAGGVTADAGTEAAVV